MKSYERSTTLRSAQECTAQDLYWAAGFMDGEGSFTRTSSSHSVTASQNQKWPVFKLLKFFGGCLERRKNSNGNLIYRWRTCGSRARGIMLTLYPLLSPRRQLQIRKALRRR